MAAGKTKPKSSGALSPALTRFAQSVGRGVPAAKGGIHIRCTDCAEQYSVENLGRAARVAQTEAPGAPIVRVTGPSSVLQDVIEGRLAASEALVRGGVRVRGNLAYLETVLRDAGLIDCE